MAPKELLAATQRAEQLIEALEALKRELSTDLVFDFLVKAFARIRG